MLRKQEGFKDEAFFVSPSGTDAIAISLWDRPESAESYSRTAYPQMLQALADMLDGTPQVKSLSARPLARLPLRSQSERDGSLGGGHAALLFNAEQVA